MSDITHNKAPRPVRPAVDLKAPPGKRVIPIVRWNDFHDWPKVKTFRYMIRVNHLNITDVVVKRGSRLLISEERFNAWVSLHAPAVLKLALKNGWVDGSWRPLVERDGPAVGEPAPKPGPRPATRDEFARKEANRLDRHVNRLGAMVAEVSTRLDKQALIQTNATRSLAFFLADSLDTFAELFRARLERKIRDKDSLL